MAGRERTRGGAPAEWTLLRVALYAALGIGLMGVAASFSHRDPTGYRQHLDTLVAAVALAGLAASARRE